MLPGPPPSAILRGEHMTSRGLRLYVCPMGVALLGPVVRGIYISCSPQGWRVLVYATYRTLPSLSYRLSRFAEDI